MTREADGKPRWRLIALDMDGTVLAESLTISAGNLAALRDAREAGVHVTFATGRMFTGLVQRYAQELLFTDPIITLNGGAVWSAQGTLLATHPFSAEQLDGLRQVAAAAGMDYVPYTAERDQDAAAFLKQDGPWIKCVFGSPSSGEIASMRRRLEDLGLFEVTNTHPFNIEVNPAGVSKATALSVVCRDLGIDPAQVVAMGDSLNDVAMLRFAGLGVAMENAADAVKAVADMVTLHHDADGVAHAIHRVLGEL